LKPTLKERFNPRWQKDPSLLNRPGGSFASPKEPCGYAVLQDDMAEDPVEAARKGLQPNIGVYLENKLRKPLESIFEYVLVSQPERPFCIFDNRRDPILAVLATGRNSILVGTVDIAGVLLENGSCCQKHVAYCSALVTGDRASVIRFSVNHERTTVLQPQQSFLNLALSTFPENAAIHLFASLFTGPYTTLHMFESSNMSQVTGGLRSSGTNQGLTS
jgi:hypothetical protein